MSRGSDTPAGDRGGQQEPITVRLSPAERAFLDELGGPNRAVRRLVRRAMGRAGRLMPPPPPAEAKEAALTFAVEAVWLNQSGGFARNLTNPIDYPGTPAGLAKAVRAAKVLRDKNPDADHVEVTAFLTASGAADPFLMCPWVYGCPVWGEWEEV